MKLSIIIPAYNEIDTIEDILFKVQGVPIQKEIIIIDDGSNDGTREFLIRLENSKDRFKLEKIGKIINTQNIRVLFQSVNQGKGAALNRGFKEAIGKRV